MWWAGSRPIDLYLGSSRMALCRGEQLIRVEAVHDLSGALSVASEALRGLGERGSVAIWLSGALCRPFILPSSVDARGGDELLSIARAMVPSKTGLVEDCEVRLEGAGTPPRLAVAVPKAVLETIRAGVSEVCRIASIRPWWATALDAALRSPQAPTAVGIHDSDALTVLAGAGGSFSLATTHAPAVDDVAVNAAWSRALLNDAVPDGPHVLVRLRSDPAPATLDGAALGAIGEVVA